MREINELHGRSMPRDPAAGMCKEVRDARKLLMDYERRAALNNMTLDQMLAIANKTINKK